MRQAIAEASRGQCNLAFEDTQLTQCHNGAAQTRLNQAGESAVCSYLAAKAPSPPLPPPPPPHKIANGSRYVTSASREGSAFVIRVKNPSDQAFSCTVGYVIDYVDAQGQPDAEDGFQSFDIPAHFTGIALQYTTDYAASTMRVHDVKYDCGTP